VSRVARKGFELQKRNAEPFRLPAAPTRVQGLDMSELQRMAEEAETAEPRTGKAGGA
jgi:hypothetical protein